MKRSLPRGHQSVMWIGAIRVIVAKDASYAATLASVRVAIARNGNQLSVLRDPEGDDLARVTPRTFLHQRLAGESL